MLSISQAKISIKTIISDYEARVEACQTMNELEEKLKYMIKEILLLIKPE